MKRVQYLEQQELSKLLKAAALERSSLASASASFADDAGTACSQLTGGTAPAPLYGSSTARARRPSTIAGAAWPSTRSATLLLGGGERSDGGGGDDESATDASTGRSIFVRYSGPQTFLVTSGPSPSDGANAISGSEVFRFELKWQEVARLYRNILFDKATPPPARMILFEYQYIYLNFDMDCSRYFLPVVENAWSRTTSKNERRTILCERGRSGSKII